MSVQKIPELDFGAYREGGVAREGFIEALGAALSTYGFVVLTGHGVDMDRYARVFSTGREVFGLSEVAKRRCEVPEAARQVGYTPWLMECAKNMSAPDLKEFWQVARTLPADHPFRINGLMYANRFPAEVPAFGVEVTALFETLETFAVQIFDAIGAWLGQPPEWLRGLVKDGNHILRVINYPDPEGPPQPGSIRSAAHEDINLLTLLPTATKPGLQLLTREGTWLPIEAPPGALVCDTGDMMAYLTGGRLPATTHRVVNPEGGRDGGRMSMPFFLHPNPDAMLAPIQGDAPPVRAHDFLMERLAANNVA